VLVFGEEEMKKLFKSIFVVIFWVFVAFALLFSPRFFKIFGQRKAINVFMWSGVVDPCLFAKFEKETGIGVNVSYYDGNEELLVKLLATGGRGYDLVVPSDYIVAFLIKNNLLKKIDKTKLDFFDKLNPTLIGLDYDPKNDYSIPSEWYILGIGFNRSLFPKGLPEASWDLLFDPLKIPQNIVVINDSRELITLALWHKYGKIKPLTTPELKEIKKILINQKKHIEAYSDFRGDFLLESGNCSLAILPSSYAWRTAAEDSNIVFKIPKEGTFISIENYVIPALSKRADLVYEFINFLFRPEHQKHNFENQILLSTRMDADYMFNEPFLKESLEYVNPQSDKRPILFHNVLTDSQVNEIWMAVKGK